MQIVIKEEDLAKESRKLSYKLQFVCDRVLHCRKHSVFDFAVYPTVLPVGQEKSHGNLLLSPCGVIWLSSPASGGVTLRSRHSIKLLPNCGKDVVTLWGNHEAETSKGNKKSTRPPALSSP